MIHPAEAQSYIEVKEAAEVGRLNALFLMLLTVPVVAMMSAGTLAACNRRSNGQEPKSAARMVFHAILIGEGTQSLGVPELQPGKSTTGAQGRQLPSD